MEGTCVCGAVRFKMTTRPLFVHCCHCTWCQRETGSAFALNAMIESDRLELIEGRPEPVETPSNSGKGQIVLRCPVCRVALWSHYAGAGEKVAFVRVGVMQDKALLPPDIHIFTSTKAAWLTLADGKPLMEGYYDWREHWPPEAQERRRALSSRSS